jgi:hypothetical protein
MANWKVIALINGEIEAVSGPAAKGRTGAHEWIVWEGPAADKGDPTPLQARVEPYALACYVYSLPLGNDSHDGKLIVGISTVGAAQPEKRHAIAGPNGNDGA